MHNLEENEKFSVATQVRDIKQYSKGKQEMDKEEIPEEEIPEEEIPEEERVTQFINVFTGSLNISIDFKE